MKRKPANTPFDTAYFLSRSIPEPNSGCWIWDGPVNASGYGALSFRGRSSRAHRAHYECANSIELPRTIDVCHTCDIRLCVNLDHLFVGSRTDNMRDCAAKGRVVIPRLRGEELTQSKLMDSDVIAIRAAVGKSQRAIAAEYGLSKSTIGHILRRKTWRHL